MFKHTIKTNIIIIFIILVSLVSFSLLFSQYYFSKNIALDSTKKTFNIITNNILNELNANSTRIYKILTANQENKNLLKSVTLDYRHPALEDLTLILNVNKSMYSIYFSDENTSLYQVVNLKNTPQTYDYYKAPKQTQWLVIINKDNLAQHTFLDKNLHAIKSVTKPKIYDINTRPWYQRALNSHYSITEPYKFANSSMLGMTIAMPLKDNKSVFAIDFTIDKFQQILADQKYENNSEIFLFDQKGLKLVSSDKNSSLTISPILLQAFNNNTHTQNKIIQYDQYYSMYMPLQNKNIFLGIEIDTTSILKPFIENLQYSLLIGILVLLLSIPFIMYSSTIITKPIKHLIVENEKIKNRQFDKVENINTSIIEFDELSLSLVSMSKNIQEYQKSQEELLSSIVKLIAEAVDAKSPYTGGHCNRVPEIAQMLVDAASQSNEGIFKDFKLDSEDDLREFHIGSWLHDCGKVTTPEYVVDKSTKLETINDRIHEVRTRFEVLWRDAKITYLEAKLYGEEEESALDTLNKTQERLLEEFTFIANANIGGEYMSEDKQTRIKDIANQEWQRNFDDSLGLGEVEILRYDKGCVQTLPATEKLLSDKKQHIIKRENFDYEAYEEHGFKEEVPEHLYNYGEVYNLCIDKGTLSPEERYKINEHVILTIKMLEKIPFPTHMTKIPEYAGTHHETLIGTGYPRKLHKDELSIAARIMAVADVFEALTASDRPYKKAKSLSESVKILSFMVKNQHLDGDIFKLFLKNDLHNVYARKYLKEEQIDEVDIEQYL